MTSSILSYPERGPYGKAAWRGNTSGFPIRDLIQFLSRQKPIQLVVDPAEGSGTCRDVCQDLGIQYVGLDLHQGFNLLQQNLRKAVHHHSGGKDPEFIFFHPPYHDMVTYSGKVWGEPHPDDLSRCQSPEEFLEKMERCLWNIHEAVETGGHYAVLIGDQRKNGEYRCFMADLIRRSAGALKNVLIKTQHNTRSHRHEPNLPFIPILHEYILLWAKDHRILSIGKIAWDRHLRLEKEQIGTWKNVVASALQALGGQSSIQPIYRWVFENVDVTRNPSTEAKIRQILQFHFERMGPGTYRMPA